MNVGQQIAEHLVERSRLSTAVVFAAEDHPVEDNTPFAMFPGVIADPKADRLHMMNPQGGIDAVELASGHLLWTSSAAGKPLAVFDDRLAAQADAPGVSRSLPIVFLDTKNGRVVSRAEIPIPPSATRPSIDDGMVAASSVQARVISQGLLVSWTVTSRPVRPIPAPVNVRNESGAAIINLQSNKVTALAPDQAANMLRGKTSAATPSLSGTEGLYFPPQPAGRFFVSLKLGAASEGQRAVMKRWSETGEPLGDIELGPGFVAYAISADQSLLLVVSGSSGPRYVWSLYTIANGQRVAEVRLPDSAAQSFFLWHSILIYRSAAMHGVDLRTGKEIWTRALRDTSYHGSYPPRP